MMHPSALRWLRKLLVPLFVLALAVPAGAASFTDLFVFGDSLSDTGNLCPLAVVCPSPPYASGRFSNGPVWVEDLAAGLGLGPVVASSASGNDYAVGGATSADLSSQIAGFQSAVGGAADAAALYVVFAGANDALNGDPLTTAAANVAGAISDLYALGARSFLVPTLPDLGATPQEPASSRQLSIDFNAAVDADLAGIPGITLYRPDLFTALDSVVASPGCYGLTDVSTACWNGVTVCTTPATWLLWDRIHPTATGHALLAQTALLSLPEPGVASLLAAALLTVAGCRRRAAGRP